MARARGEVTGRKRSGTGTVASVPPAWLTIKMFCRAHHLSEAMFHKMKNEGWGPRTTNVGARVMITHEAAAAWRAEREAATQELRLVVSMLDEGPTVKPPKRLGEAPRGASNPGASSPPATTAAAPQTADDAGTEVPSTTAVKHRRGPQPGTVARFRKSDEALFPEIERLIAEGKTPTAAAKELAKAGKIKGLNNSKLENRAARLARLYTRSKHR
jgi:hypothetical protein